MNAGEEHALAAWLLDPASEPPSVATLRAVGLAAHAYASLPPEHATRPLLRRDFLAARVRHERIKAELLPLIRAWNAAGIEPLLFKGFHLAEFVYPTPGMRFHGDVDVLVGPRQIDEASAIAASLGWSEAFTTAAVGEPYLHNACTLFGPEGAACIDLHRWALPCLTPFHRVPRRVTQAVWDAARQRTWEGTRIYEMSPADAAIIGVMLARCWGADRWHLKPHDAPDLSLLLARAGASGADIRTRARELGAERTVSHFLARCDPTNGRLSVRAPTPRELRRWDRDAFREYGPLGATERWLRRLALMPSIVRSVVRAVPSVLMARIALRRHRDMPALLDALTAPVGPGPCSPGTRMAVVQGVTRALRMIPRNTRGDCLLRALTLFVALRRVGCPVRFVSGVRRETSGVVGHAWVELDGRVLAELSEPDNRNSYAVVYEYP